MTGISIGLYINKKLIGNPDFVALVNDKVFPITTKKEISFPFVVYKRDGLTPNYTKDSLNGDEINITFIVASDEYFKSVEIAEVLRSTLEEKRSKEFGISETKLSSASEDVVDDTFIQVLVFSFKIDY